MIEIQKKVTSYSLQSGHILYFPKLIFSSIVTTTFC